MFNCVLMLLLNMYFSLFFFVFLPNNALSKKIRNIILRHYIVQIFTLRRSYFAKNTVISPDFLVWKFYSKTKFSHSFRWIAWNGMRKLFLSTKFPHQEIRWNYSIFRSELFHRVLALKLSVSSLPSWIYLLKFNDGSKKIICEIFS